MWYSKMPEIPHESRRGCATVKHMQQHAATHYKRPKPTELSLFTAGKEIFRCIKCTQPSGLYENATHTTARKKCIENSKRIH